MANADAPFGLRPVRYISGAPYAGAANIYHVPATDNTAIYVGGLVKTAGTTDADGVMTVTGNVATGNPVIGVVVGVLPTTADSPTYRAASTLRYVLVADDPNLLFEVQADDGGAAFAITGVGGLCDLTGFTSGSTTTGLSSIEVDSSTLDVVDVGDEDVLILGFTRSPDNEVGAANANVLVRLNNHFLVDNALPA